MAVWEHAVFWGGVRPAAAGLCREHRTRLQRSAATLGRGLRH